MDPRFLLLITNLQAHLKLQSNVLNKYVVMIKPEKMPNLVWIKDHLNLIGHLTAHYEIIMSEKDNSINVEIHFEHKDLKKRQMFRTKIPSPLPPKVKLVDGDISSLRIIFLDSNLKLTDPEILEKICKRLLYFETTGLAGQIRKLLP